MMDRSVRILGKAAGSRFRISSIGFSPSERAWTLRGMENLLCGMIVSPTHDIPGDAPPENILDTMDVLDYQA